MAQPKRNLKIKTETVIDKGQDVKKLAYLLEETLKSFGVTTRVVEVNYLDKEIEFCLEVALGTNIKKIEKVDTTIAMALASRTGKVKIQAPIPGRALVGIRVPMGNDNLSKNNYKIIEKVVEVEKVVDRSWWKNITFILGNIFDLLREGFEKLSFFFWKISRTNI